ncbi:unnamed protein product [Macrosiphum euphorbiae]|uniref:Uncharacterized protein n=1 Tax=Macrosiphum euphorbiae TaxID=13131 RepID=A0AAV0VTR7_9HEMI|nr:unnamed protein product [Macrosiphum euphorbiae]
MGEPNTKTNKLNEKLIASSKVSNNKQNVIAKSGPSGDIADNATNEPLSSQHSDNDYNSDAIKSTDEIISYHDYTNKTNHMVYRAFIISIPHLMKTTLMNQKNTLLEKNLSPKPLSTLHYPKKNTQ